MSDGTPSTDRCDDDDGDDDDGDDDGDGNPLNGQDGNGVPEEFDFEYDGGNSSSRLFERSRIRALAGNCNNAKPSRCSVTVRST